MFLPVSLLVVDDVVVVVVVSVAVAVLARRWARCRRQLFHKLLERVPLLLDPPLALPPGRLQYSSQALALFSE